MSNTPINVKSKLRDIINEFEYGGVDKTSVLWAIQELIRDLSNEQAVFQYPHVSQWIWILHIALALRNDIIFRMKEHVSDDSLSTRARNLLGLWFGLNNQLQKYINYLDPQFPDFKGERVLDSYTRVLIMMEGALDFFTSCSPIDDNAGDMMYCTDFDEDVRLGNFVDYDGFGYFTDGEVVFDLIKIYPSEWQERRTMWPCFSQIVWYNR